MEIPGQQSALDRMRAGEEVPLNERIDAAKDIMAFSSRDWSTDPELWALYQLIHGEAISEHES